VIEAEKQEDAMTRYEIRKNRALVGEIILGPHKKVLRTDYTEIVGDKHTCDDETDPDQNDQLHLRNFGEEKRVELRGHAKFEKSRRRFFHDEPPVTNSGIIAQDDWEAADSGGLTGPPGSSE
jgi:hypothetical protein